MKSIKWYFRMPGMVCCGDLEFYDPVSESEARAELRECSETRRLPNGTEIYV